jgi:predicted N-acetyltransferase YhbS
MFDITAERPEDGPVIDHLLDQAFGPGRHAKASYRYREDVAPERPLCLVARDAGGRVVGSIRHWRVVLGQAGAPGLLLGPLAVDPALRDRGIGRALVWRSLDMAAAAGHRIVLLVGDLAYYRQFGFRVAPPDLVMPGERPERLLVTALAPGALDGVRGTVRPAYARRSVRRLTPATALGPGVPRRRCAA